MGWFNHQQESISCFKKKQQDGLAGIDFAMWKLAEVTWMVFSGRSGGLMDEIQGYHVLGCIIKRVQIPWKFRVLLRKMNFLTWRVLDGMFDGYIVYHDDCLSCWTNEDGLLDAALSCRNAKGEICKPYDSSPHFCKTVPNENVPSWCFFSRVQCHQHLRAPPPAQRLSWIHHDFKKWWSSTEFCNFKSQVTVPLIPYVTCQHCPVPLIMQLLRQWAPFKTSWVFAAVVEVLDSFIRPPTHSIPGWFWRESVVNISVYEGFDWCLSNWNGCEKLWTSCKTPGVSRNFEIQVHVSNKIGPAKKKQQKTRRPHSWGEWSWPWRSWIDRSRGQWLVGQPRIFPEKLAGKIKNGYVWWNL